MHVCVFDRCVSYMPILLIYICTNIQINMYIGQGKTLGIIPYLKGRVSH